MGWVKADQFLTAMQKNLDNTNIFSLLGGMAKATFSESIGDIAKKLIRLHRPITIDYAAKFGLADTSHIPGVTPLTATQFSHSAHRLASVAVAPVPPAVSSGGMSTQFGHSALATPVAAPAVQPPIVVPAYQCRKCQSTDISIQHGKFGYYFKCGSCDGNTPIKLGCSTEGHKERLRKDGLRFYRECADCQSSAMYFTNPQQMQSGT